MTWLAWQKGDDGEQTLELKYERTLLLQVGTEPNTTIYRAGGHILVFLARLPKSKSPRISLASTANFAFICYI